MVHHERAQREKNYKLIRTQSNDTCNYVIHILYNFCEDNAGDTHVQS
jgi:hypothetical protein